MRWQAPRFSQPVRVRCAGTRKNLGAGSGKGKDSGERPAVGVLVHRFLRSGSLPGKLTLSQGDAVSQLLTEFFSDYARSLVLVLPSRRSPSET